jgi:hypothetical protein
MIRRHKLRSPRSEQPTTPVPVLDRRRGPLLLDWPTASSARREADGLPHVR